MAIYTRPRFFARSRIMDSDMQQVFIAPGCMVEQIHHSLERRRFAQRPAPWFASAPGRDDGLGLLRDRCGEGG
jgi:hypothetical protein